jgi:hypothetical protein
MIDQSRRIEIVEERRDAAGQINYLSIAFGPHHIH